MCSLSNHLSGILERFPAPHEALNHLIQTGILIREAADCSPTGKGFTASHTYRTLIASQSCRIEAHGEGPSKAKARDQCVKDAMVQFRVLLGLDSAVSSPSTTPRAHDAAVCTRPVLGLFSHDSSLSSVPGKRLPLELVLARVSSVMQRFPLPHEALNFMEQSTEISRSQMTVVEETAGVFVASQMYHAPWGWSSDSFLAKGTATSKSSARANCYTDAVSQLCHLTGHEPLFDHVSSNGSSSPRSIATPRSTPPSSPSLSQVPFLPGLLKSVPDASRNEPQTTRTTKQMRSLQQAREHVVVFERLMDSLEGVYDEEPTLLLAIDVEANEKRNHTGKQEVLEVGLVRERLGENRTARSVVVEERRHIRNERAVNDPESFAHGQPEYLRVPDIWGIVQQAIDEMTVGNNRFVVVHTYVNDHKWLVDEGVDLNGVSVCDIAQVQRYWEGAMQNKGLVKMSEEYGVANHTPSHSGGNDAWTTLDVLQAMIVTCRPWLAHAFQDHTLARVGGKGLLSSQEDFSSLL